MPSFEHGALVQLFRDAPTLVPSLLASPLGVPVPPGGSVAIAESTLDLVGSVDYRADLVVELRDSTGTLVLCVVVEVQLQRDSAKRMSWPAYLALLRARSRCPVALLVVAPDASVAAWAAEQIDLGPGAWVRPLVVGPDQIPRISDPEEAARLPGLALLSARVHGGRTDGGELVPAVAAALSRIDRPAAAVYFSYVYKVLDAAARRALEEMVMAFDISKIDPNWRLEDTEFGKRLPYLYIEQQRRKAVAEGRAEGALQARRELLGLFVARAGLALSDEQRAQIEACTDAEALDRWIERAIEARSAEELFA